MTEEMIRDRLIVGIRNATLSQKMQMDSKLTLERAKQYTNSSVGRLGLIQTLTLFAPNERRRKNSVAAPTAAADGEILHDQRQIQSRRNVAGAAENNILQTSALLKTPRVTTASTKDILACSATPRQGQSLVNKKNRLGTLHV